MAWTGAWADAGADAEIATFARTAMGMAASITATTVFRFNLITSPKPWRARQRGLAGPLTDVFSCDLPDHSNLGYWSTDLFVALA